MANAPWPDLLIVAHTARVIWKRRRLRAWGKIAASSASAWIMEKRLYFIIGDLIANTLVGPTAVFTQR